MQTARTYVLTKFPLIGTLSAAALIVFAAACLLVAAIELNAIAANVSIDNLVGLLLGVFLVLTFGLMIWVTWIVLRARRELVTWRLFLALTWLVPYLGVACALGIPTLRNRVRRGKTHPNS